MSIESFQAAKQEIKRAADIVDLISQFVQLKKAGKNYVGLCPFHSEKEPSFAVSGEKQIFHCFGCKKGGDIFAFWMAYHGCSFPEAIKDLAEKYNVTLPDRRLSSQEKKRAEERENIFQINRIAADYFHNVFKHSPEAGQAREYALKRGLDESLIQEFTIGYSLDQWSGLADYLAKRGISLKLAARAGLVVEKRNGGFYDRFRDRIIFPIFDLKGYPVGFGGRVLGNEMPKYLNTPETPVFKKGEILYGLNVAYEHIRRAGKALVVEGYMDLLALRSNGIGEVVATLGTAITSGHIRRLKGYASEIILIFDSDEAGIKAALRSLPLFLNEGVEGKAVMLPDGHDPDSFVREKGVERFMELVGHAKPLFEFYLSQSTRGEDVRIEDRAHTLEELIPCLSEIRAAALQSLYVRRVAEVLGIRENIVWSELRDSRKRKFGPQHKHTSLMSKIQGGDLAKKFSRDIHLLNLLIHHPQKINELIDCEWKVLLSDPVVVKLTDLIFKAYLEAGEFSPQDLMDTIEEEPLREQLREAMFMPSFYSVDAADVAVREIKDKIESIKLSCSIRAAKERGDIEELNQLLKLKAKRHQSLY